MHLKGVGHDPVVFRNAKLEAAQTQIREVDANETLGDLVSPRFSIPPTTTLSLRQTPFFPFLLFSSETYSSRHSGTLG